MANNFDLQLQAGVKLSAMPNEIENLQKSIQAQFNAAPIKVKIDVDNGGTRGSSESAKRLTSEYKQLSEILKQVNADRVNLTKASIGKDDGGVRFYSQHIRELSDEMSKLLGITSGVGKDKLFGFLQQGDTAGLTDSWRRAGIEAESIIKLLQQQALAQHKVATAAMTASDKFSTAEKKKQDAVEKSNASQWQSKFKESVRELTAPNVDLKPLNDYYRQLETQMDAFYRKYATAEQRLGGNYFDSITKEINQIGGDPGKIQETQRLLESLKNSWQQLRIEVESGKSVTPELLDKMLADERNLSASLTNLRQGAKVTNKELTNQAQIDRAITDLQRFFDKYESNIRNNSAILREYQALQDKIMSGGYGDTNVDTNRKKMEGDIAAFRKSAQEAGIEVESLSARIKKLFGAHFGTAVVMLGINALRQSLSQVWTNVKELDKAVVDLGIASGLNRAEVQKLTKEYSSLGKEIGATTVEVSNSADSWLRQGYSLEDSNKLIRDTMMLSKLGQIDSAEAATALTSTMKGYKLSVEDATDVVSRFVAVDMEASVTAGGLAKALSETAVSADTAGVSLDRVIGYLAKVSEVTQDGPESVGVFFKSMFARMGNIKAGRLEDPETMESLNDVETVLSTLGIKLRENEKDWRSFQDVLDDVAAKWTTYSETQRRALANAFGVTRNQEKFLVLMENYDDALALAGVSANSAGTATEKYQTYLDGLGAHLDSLTASFESLSSTVLNSDFVKTAVDGLTSVITLIDNLASTIGTLPTLIGAAGAAFALANRGVVGNNGKHRYAPYTRVAA